LPDASEVRILVWNQIDRAGAASEPPPERRAEFSGGWVACSAKKRTGLDQVAALVRGSLDREVWSANAAQGLSERHRQALRSAQTHLEEVRAGFAQAAPLDWIAEDLRQATDALDGISGRTTAEDLLSKIFGQFCIGK
jgi:tRNA modification GTPase